MSPKPYLIADIGGTNARFSLGDSSACSRNLVLATERFPSPVEAIESYLEYSGQDCPEYACLGIAAPLDSDSFQMINNDWHFDKQQLRRHFGFKELHFINDFAALALSIPQLTADDIETVDHIDNDLSSPIAVVGPGTGMGTAALVQINDQHFCISSEASHICLQPGNDLEAEILEYLLTKYPRVSLERMVSGRGLENIYEALCAIKNRNPTRVKAEEVAHLALSGASDLALCAMDVFFDLLASFAGDVALMFKASGGVYIGGGIASKHRDLIVGRDMRERFSNKGRLSTYLRQIPIYLITAELSALQGARLALDNLVRHNFRSF